MIHGEELIVAQSEEEIGPGKEAGVVDGATVILHLKESIIFVGDGHVVDVDEAIRAAREEALRPGEVELYFGHVIIVAFDIPLHWFSRRTCVPVLKSMMSLSHEILFLGSRCKRKREKDHNDTAASAFLNSVPAATLVPWDDRDRYGALLPKTLRQLPIPVVCGLSRVFC